MFRPLIAGVTALSMTLATAAPVQAQGLDQEDIGKILLGLTALAVVGAAVNNKRDNDRAAERATPVHDRSRNDSWSDLARDQERDRARNNRDRNRNRRNVLPSACLTDVETRYGYQRMFGKRCLERNYRHASSLPERCEVRVFGQNRPRNGFDPLCLRDAGYRSDRRNASHWFDRTSRRDDDDDDD